ncbi:MAG: nitronate monooxygenase, partial [Rhodocyclales bacterium]|nr:nitronate monooxygenase [Rhodocyclales bacterium]
NLPAKDKTAMSFGSESTAKAWKDIWGAGQGVGSIDAVRPAAEVIAAMKGEYEEARGQLLVVSR